tara:strand:- start:751 stop:1347 length:597 start_codon:yes stop_codon:yes gene_type:complete
MNKITAIALCLTTVTPAMGSITWDGARFIRNGLAEWYDDIGGNGVSNIYFLSDDQMLYTGNDSNSGEHWLNEEFSAPGVYDYTFLASNNLGQTGTTVYNLEINFNGQPMTLIQASTTNDYNGGLVYSDGDLQIEVTHYGFEILPIGAGGIDEVGNFDSTPDGSADIVGYLQFTVTTVPAPTGIALIGLGGLAYSRRSR